MPRLFIKIFLWFWLAMTLIGGILVTLALTSNPQQAFLERQKHRLSKYGNELVRLYEKKGAQGLTERILQLQQREKIRLALVNARTQHLGQQPEQPYLQGFAIRALTESMLSPLSEAIRARPMRNDLTFSIPLADDYFLLAELAKPSQLELLLDPHALTLRLGATFLVAGIICYLLARSISAPIMKLRKAAQEFSAGHLSTRVSPSFGRNRGELAELAHDFDTMAERIESLLAAQQRLLRDISHELRSPLARLGVALELVRRGANGNNDPLARIEKEAERLNDLIGQLLAITRLESLTDLIIKEPIDLAELLETIVADANFESQSQNRRVAIATESKVSVIGSQELMGRAFENVIRNALQHTAEGTTVDVHLGFAKDNGWPEVRIKDYGQGVPSHNLEKLFQPFFRVSESRNRQSGGYGVGLAIAERAIKLHGGRITAANHPDGGMLFTIQLPPDTQSSKNSR
ncbi:MAG: ATP-binding protein [Thermodesulfobacteriota bacterium]